MRVRSRRTLGVLALAAALLLPAPRPAAAQDISGLESVVPAPVMKRVLRSNPELAARRNALAAARARLDAAGFAGPAVLSGEVEDIPGGTKITDAGFRLEVGREFMTGGRSEAARAAAAAEVETAAAELHATELRVRAATARAVVRTLGWSAIADRLAAEDSLLIGAESSLRTRFAAADARYTDVLRLRTERIRVQTERAKAMAEADVGLTTLQGLLGPDASAPELDSFTDVPVSALTLEELPPAPDLDSLFTLSGPVRVARAALARQEASREAVLADQSPRIAGGLGIQRVEGTHGGFAVGPTLGFSVSLPFTARGANRAAEVAANRAVGTAEAELAAARSDTRTRLRSALTRYEVARERLAVFDAALLRGVRQEREGALAAYRSGGLSLIELLDLERALTRAEIDRRRTHIQAISALADLVSGAAGSELSGGFR